MTKDDFQIITFNPLIATWALLEKYLNWREELHKESNPNDPLPKREAIIQQIKNQYGIMNYNKLLIS
jgi:hypothetical protein